MSKHRKTWSESEKLAILNYQKEHGISQTCQQYTVSSATIYGWSSEFESPQSSAHSQSSIAQKEAEIKRLRREIQAYKEMLAERDLEIRVKNELLKKKT